MQRRAAGASAPARHADHPLILVKVSNGSPREIPGFLGTSGCVRIPALKTMSQECEEETFRLSAPILHSRLIFPHSFVSLPKFAMCMPVGERSISEKSLQRVG